MGLADVHAHLTHPRLAVDLPGVLERARAAGLTTILSNGLNPLDNQRVAELAAREALVRPAFGFYPVDAVLPELLARGVELARADEPCTASEGIEWVRAHAQEAFAIGEIGLDGHWVPEDLWAAQEDVFRRLLEIALEAGKAVILHTRKRERRALEILREMRVERACWHCFGGKVALARAVAEAGYHLSIPANARRSESFTRMLETLPRERLLLETDCPYLGPERSGTNEPATIAGTARYAAEIWGVKVDEVVERTAENFATLFGSAA